MEEKPKFKAAVEVSRKWDGNQVAIELSIKIKNKCPKPRFILLFTTIHYEGEFEKILSGLKKEFPDIPIIGGTIAGFMTQEGCYTRGVTAFSIDYPNMDIAVGIGQNTKKNPIKASLECTEMIKSNIKENKYSEKFLFLLPSGSKVPSLSGSETKRIYKTKVPSSMLSGLLKTSIRLYQRGVGKEDIILDCVSHELPDFKIIGGSSIDDNKMEKNFQFFNDQIYSNSVIGLSIISDISITMDSQVAVEKTDKYFKVQTTGEKYVISKIDDKPATKTLFDYLNWPDFLIDEKFYRTTFFYPIIFEENGEIFPEVIGALFGNSIVCGFDFKSDTACIGQSSRKILQNVLKTSLKKISDNGTPKFSMIIYCSALLETLGIDFFKVQEIIKEVHHDSPFLLISMGGEDFCIPNKILKHTNETINMAAFS
jgi:hypothetical protein